MRFMQTESVLQTKNRSGPAKNQFSVALVMKTHVLMGEIWEIIPKKIIKYPPGSHQSIKIRIFDTHRLMKLVGGPKIP